MTAKKKVRRKKTAQTAVNERMSFDDLCMSWRPVFDRCMSMEGEAVFDETIPEVVLSHMKFLSKKSDPNRAFGCFGFAMQAVLVAYTHVLNNIERSNPGIKRKIQREFLNSLYQSPFQEKPAAE